MVLHLLRAKHSLQARLYRLTNLFFTDPPRSNMSRSGTLPQQNNTPIHSGQTSAGPGLKPCRVITNICRLLQASSAKRSSIGLPARGGEVLRNSLEHQRRSYPFSGYLHFLGENIPDFSPLSYVTRWNIRDEANHYPGTCIYLEKIYRIPDCLQFSWRKIRSEIQHFANRPSNSHRIVENGRA